MCYEAGIPIGMIFFLVATMYNPVINSLVSGRCGIVMFNFQVYYTNWDTHGEIALGWMPQNLTNEKSTLVEVMAFCHQAASHYLGQFWSRSMLPYDFTGPLWVSRKKNGPGNVTYPLMNTFVVEQCWLITEALEHQHISMKIELRN